MCIVIECRGYGIEYTVFSGSKNECIEWIEENTESHPMNDTLRVNKELTVNGNGNPFTYEIRRE